MNRCSSSAAFSLRRSTVDACSADTRCSSAFKLAAAARARSRSVSLADTVCAIDSTSCASWLHRAVVRFKASHAAVSASRDASSCALSAAMRASLARSTVCRSSTARRRNCSSVSAATIEPPQLLPLPSASELSPSPRTVDCSDVRDPAEARTNDSSARAPPRCSESSSPSPTSMSEATVASVIRDADSNGLLPREDRMVLLKIAAPAAAAASNSCDRRLFCRRTTRATSASWLRCCSRRAASTAVCCCCSCGEPRRSQSEVCRR